MMKKYWNSFKCFWGFHDLHSPIVADLDGYWLQAGDKCTHCGKWFLHMKHATHLFEYCYSRGKKEEHNKMLAYAGGLDEILRMYPNELKKRGYEKIHSHL